MLYKSSARINIGIRIESSQCVVLGFEFGSWNSNIKIYLSTAALPGQTTKMALKEEFMFQNVAYWPTVYITGINSFIFWKWQLVLEYFFMIILVRKNQSTLENWPIREQYFQISPPPSNIGPVKGQLISKVNLKKLIWTKMQQKYFCISALASKYL